jgi:hypothetical protein
VQEGDHEHDSDEAQQQKSEIHFLPPFGDQRITCDSASTWDPAHSRASRDQRQNQRDERKDMLEMYTFRGRARTRAAKDFNKNEG